MLVKSLGKKIRLVWSAKHMGPASQVHRSLLSHDIGAAVRTHVEMLATTFYELEPFQKDAVKKYLELYYDLPSSDLKMWAFIDEQSQKRYSNWKSECRAFWVFTKGKAFPIEFLDRPRQWDYLVNKEFKDPDKQAVSIRNKANKSKNPNAINHHSGSKPISHRVEEYMNNGNLAPYAAAAVDAYLPSKRGKEKAQQLQNTVQEVLKKRKEPDTENPQPLTYDDQCELIQNSFGERKGTGIRGMGGAVKRHAKRQGGPHIVLTEESDERTREFETRTREAEASAQLARMETQKLQEQAEANKELARIETQKLQDQIKELRALVLQSSKSSEAGGST